MPNITVELIAGRTIDQRREFVRRVTDAAVEVLGTQPEAVRIVFKEHAMDYVSRAGLLRCDIDGPK